MKETTYEGNDILAHIIVYECVCVCVPDPCAWHSPGRHIKNKYNGDLWIDHP